MPSGVYPLFVTRVSVNSVSFIIPVKRGGYVAALDHVKITVPDNIRYEILLAEGSAPSLQRNRAAQEAKGDILYFLDDDSLITSDNLDHCIDGMVDPDVAVIGGPSITPADDNWLQLLFGFALASAFGSGAVNNRYRIYGKIRETTDKELILCNLAVRRSVFIDLGGFNECLYPNEENEFLERVTSAGYKLLHDPGMFVFRSQRKTMKAFVRQMFSYGRGRGQQSRVTSSYSAISLIPLFFVAYLFFSLLFIKYLLLLMPLVIYLCAAFISMFLVLLRTGRIFAIFLICLYPLMHTVNGLGLLWGLLNGKPDPVHDSSISIRRIKAFGEKSR
jgi:GT2 family glycosyltransferase